MNCGEPRHPIRKPDGLAPSGFRFGRTLMLGLAAITVVAGLHTTLVTEEPASLTRQKTPPSRETHGQPSFVPPIQTRAAEAAAAPPPVEVLPVAEAFVPPSPTSEAPPLPEATATPEPSPRPAAAPPEPVSTPEPSPRDAPAPGPPPEATATEEPHIHI